MSQLRLNCHDYKERKKGQVYHIGFYPTTHKPSLLLPETALPGSALSALIDSAASGVASSFETGATEELFVFQFRLELAIQHLLTHRQRSK